MNRVTEFLKYCIVLAIGCALVAVVAIPAQAQTLSVIHHFTGARDGAFPHSGVIADGGNLYGTVPDGGSGTCNRNGLTGCGLVYKLQRRGSGWILVALYQFTGEEDGSFPEAGVSLGPNGVLYGTTTGYYPTIYSLRPTIPHLRQYFLSLVNNVLYTFTGSPNLQPSGPLSINVNGHIYGTTAFGGPNQHATVYEFADGVETDLYTFQSDVDGGNPLGGVILDSAGNFFGATYDGGNLAPCGMIFELVHTTGGWSENHLSDFGG